MRRLVPLALLVAAACNNPMLPPLPPPRFPPPDSIIVPIPTPPHLEVSMSWNLTVHAKDEHYEGALAQQFNAEKSYTHHTPAARRTLAAIQAFLAGAGLNLPKGSAIAVTTVGHVDNDGYGSLTIQVRIGKANLDESSPALFAGDVRDPGLVSDERPAFDDYAAHVEAAEKFHAEQGLSAAEGFAEGAPEGTVPE